MRRFLLSAANALMLFTAMVSFALADNGPHNRSSSVTNKCALCHRTHSSGAASDTAAAIISLCYGCHGAKGTGADTDVEQGYLAARGGASGGPVGAPLKGGGFAQAKMSTAVSDTAMLKPTTSAHLINGVPGTLWGSGSINAAGDPGQSGFQLTCISCHDPHGNGNYRILRKRPVGSDVAADLLIPDEPVKTYTVDGANAGYNYFGLAYVDSAPLSAWCASCHTRYLADANAGHTASGDAIFAYRHPSDGNGNPGCLSCHVAHGSTASMDASSQAVPWPGGGPRGNTSNLLRLDNRGLCQACHKK